MTNIIHHTSIDLEIPFHDVDMMEIVWHGYYWKPSITTTRKYVTPVTGYR